MTASSKFDGLSIHVMDTALIEPGDVLLTRNAEGTKGAKVLASKVIANLTKGPFSHALICTVPPTFTEAVPQHGVVNLSAVNCFAFSLRNVRVLRFRDKAIAGLAAKNAMLMLGQPYSYLKALFTVSDLLRPEPSDAGTICSLVVAASFDAAGAEEFRSLDLKRCVPNTFPGMVCFQDVTESLFRQILSPRNAEAMHAFDGSRNEMPSTRQSILFREYLADAAPEIELVCAELPEGYRPKSFFDALSLVDTVLASARENGFPPETPLVRNAKAVDAKLSASIRSGELLAVVMQLKAKDDLSMIRIRRQVEQIEPDIDIPQIRSLLKVTRDTIRERSEALSRRPHSLALADWLDLERQALAVMHEREEVLSTALQAIDGSVPS